MTKIQVFHTQSPPKTQTPDPQLQNPQFPLKFLKNPLKFP